MYTTLLFGTAQVVLIRGLSLFHEVYLRYCFTVITTTTSLVPRPHPLMWKRGLVAFDAILGPNAF